MIEHGKKPFNYLAHGQLGMLTTLPQCSFYWIFQKYSVKILYAIVNRVCLGIPVQCFVGYSLTCIIGGSCSRCLLQNSKSYTLNCNYVLRMGIIYFTMLTLIRVSVHCDLIGCQLLTTPDCFCGSSVVQPGIFSTPILQL